MKMLSDPSHFRRLVAGSAMIVAPILLLIGGIVHPEQKTDEAAQLSVVAGNLDQWFISHLFAFAGLILLVPVVLGLMHLLRERGAMLGHVGGALGLTGILAATGIVAIDGFAVWQMAQPGASSVEMTALMERLNDTVGVFIPFFLLSFALALGFVVLAAGLYRAKAVQSWMAAFLVIAAVVFAVGFAVASNALVIIGEAFAVVGLGSIGRMLLTETDEDWEHTPEYKGFRPLPGMR